MKTTKGLFLDTVLNDTPPGYCVFAKNLLLTEKLGIIQNEPGFEFIATLPYPVIGLLPIQDKVVIWMAGTNYSEIGVFNNTTNTYSKVISDTELQPGGSKFNFNQSYPIQAEFYINVRGEIIVAWIDDINTPKILNITTPSFQVNDLELFPAANLSVPKATVNQTGGSLLTGAYRILYYFEDDDGTTSNFSATSNVVSIIRDNSSATTVWGSSSGQATSKAITFTLTVDKNWSFVNIVVLKTINSITSAVQVKKLPTSAANLLNTLTNSYTGSEQETLITLQEILTPKAFYKTAKAITQLNNKLYLGNLTVEDELKFQKIAMNVVIQWRSKLTTDSSFGTDSNYKEASGTRFAGFQHGEVYAFYLQVRDKKTGLWSKGFHIPGRAVLGGDTSFIIPSPSGPNVSGSGSPSFRRYQLEDTCATLGSTSATNKFGRMGYWANLNEVYPNNDEYNGAIGYDGSPIFGGRDLRGQQVLHHKFPTISFIRSSVFNGAPQSTGYASNYLDVLSIDVSNVNIPSSLQPKISGWRICYAKRDYSSATVLGVSNIYFYGVGETSQRLKPTPGNFGVNQVSPGDDIFMSVLSDATAAGSEFIRFHAFNLLIDKPSIAPTYLRQEMRLNYFAGTSAAASTDPRLITDTTGAGAVRKWAFYGPGITVSTSTPSNAHRFRNVSFIQYLPNGGIISSSGKTIDHTAGEDCLLLRNNITGISSNANKILDVVTASDPFMWNNSWKHVTYLSSLCVLRSDVYNSFFAQELVATSAEVSVVSATSSSDIFGGDTWTGFHSVHLQGPVADNSIVATNPGGELLGEGSKAVHYFPTESVKNLNYRYQDSADPQSVFYTATDLFPKITNSQWQTRYLGLMNLLKSPVYLYNQDYNTLNDIGVNLTSYDVFTKTETLFPTTIANSQTQSNEAVEVNWKNFLVADRYTMPRNKGNLINLQAVGNQRLYIHHENALYITKDRTTLKGNVADVTLGSGNIFDVTPFEVLSSDQGYAGTQHKFGCILTKIGYVFSDVSQGKIFIHNGDQLEEISKNGLRQFWRDNLNSDLPDNPFINTGITITYDEVLNRLLLTVKDASNNKFITASYSPQLQAWSSFHDYDPSYLYSTWNNRTYSILTVNQVSKIYRHNVGVYGQYYQTDDSKFPMIVDTVFNANPYETKYITAVNWITQVLNSTNTPIPDDTVNYITVRSNVKTTGRIAVSKINNIEDIYTSNTRLTETHWSYNNLRSVSKYPLTTDLVLDFYNNYNINPAALDLTKEWYNTPRFVDNFAAVRFEYSNLNNNKLYLLDTDVEYRKSYRG